MPLQATSGAASYDGFGGGVVAEPNYIESCFSTYLYTGNATARSIENGIDLATKGGLVWIKNRTFAGSDHQLFDTARGATKRLFSNLTDAEVTTAGTLTSFDTTGFSIGTQSSVNFNTYPQVSWSIAKAPKFFDIQTWTGSGANRTISHSLGSVPACIIVKRTDSTGDWRVYHRSLSNTEFVSLNLTSAVASDSGALWNSTTPTSTVFSIGTSANVNASGGTYVAYLFAHDAGGFGLTGTDNVISCGSFTTNGSGNVSQVSLGYEPQWVLYKTTDVADNWRLVDSMRGMPVTAPTGEPVLKPNLSDAEQADAGVVVPNATGFSINGASPSFTYIYIAIRRGPMKVPTSGTSVFDAEIWSGNTTTQSATRSIAGIGSPTDLFIGSERNPGFNQNYFYDRLRGTDTVGGLLLVSSLTASETTNSPGYGQYSFAQQDGITLGNYTLNYTGRTYVGWQFKRAPSFFDVCCYTGTGSAQALTHNLTVVPEMMIVKRRDSATAGSWFVYASFIGNGGYLALNDTTAVDYWINIWNDTTPTSTQFTVGSYLSQSGGTHVAYLFATCAGVSKVGSYTGTGSTQTINCGFTGGARFVLIKASSTTGNWYVWDTARGIVSGNDPYLWLNSPYASAEVTNTDWVDTASTGFELSNAGGNLANSNGVSYIFLAIA